MAEESSFENELAELLANSGDISMNITENIQLPTEVLPPAAPVEKSKERVLSQAEIDALLASMMG
jgi:hypothetical protein